jgi:hypothetical protein
MHIQAKAKAAKSAPDLEAFLKVMSEPATPQNPNRQPINIEGVSGDDLETSGYVTFSFDHDRAQQVRDWLEEAGYTDVTFSNAEDGGHFQTVLVDEPGQLLAAVREATTQNLAFGRIIKTVLVGRETQPPNRLYVNISFQEVKTG